MAKEHFLFLRCLPKYIYIYLILADRGFTSFAFGRMAATSKSKNAINIKTLSDTSCAINLLAFLERAASTLGSHATLVNYRIVLLLSVCIFEVYNVHAYDAPYAVSQTKMSSVLHSLQM